MEYERIHKVQMGVISPSKLRMRLLGAPHHKRKEGGNNSSRTSPSKLEDTEFAKNSLLSSKNIDDDEAIGSSKDSDDASAPNAVAPNIESFVRESSDKEVPDGQDNQPNSFSMDMLSKENGETDHDELQNVPKGILYQVLSGISSTVHPVRSIDDGNGYDSGHDNGSSSSFEFHKGERPPINSVAGPFSRPVPSKWTDAEKWIVKHPNLLKKSVLQSQGSRQVLANSVKVAPETLIPEQRASVVHAADNKKIDFYLSKSQNVLEKFPYVPWGSHPISEQGHVTSTNRQSDLPICQKKMNHDEPSIADRTGADTAVTPTVKSVSMRDMGTEMTPMTSQEPSRTGTPIAATTPTRSPISSRSSTPRRGEPAPSPVELMREGESKNPVNCKKIELSEREFQMKIRKEIGALGVQLGKMNIAAWASKDEVANTDSLKAVEVDQLQKIEFETRAAAWEDAEKSKHMARFKREGVKIHVWESHQKAKYEAKMREVETQAEQMRVNAQEKMMKKLAITKQRFEEKLAAAEARKNQQAARTAQQVEHIRRTGHIPPSHFHCCSWFS